MRALAVVVCLLLSSSVAGAQVETTEMVAMRDGTRLATTVWRADDTPRPVLLRRTPYGRAIAADTVSGVLSQGYVLISQDTRGRGDSEGEYLPFANDAEDGFDAIAWIAAQPYSNGRVGTYGGSAEGITQLMAAGEAPPALSCALPTVATAYLHEAFYPGGAWRSELGTAWLTGLGEPAALAEMRTREARDARWDPMRWDADEVARIDIPILLVGGTFDIFAIGTPHTFHALRTESAAPDDQFLVLGPWTHGGPGLATQGELTFDASSVYTQAIVELIAFFDWCLKDGPRPDWSPVRYWVSRIADEGATVSGEWRDAEDWPPPSTPVTLTIHADGSLHAGAGEDATPIALASDPAAPIPSLGGGNLTTAAGPHDQASLDARDDVFVAETAPVDAEVEVIGDVRASIYAASPSEDVDAIVRLSQVTPSGRAWLLADGIRRGRFARSLETAEPLTPGQPVMFEIDVGPVSIVLPPGHALRVAIQATSSPRYEPNPGTSAPIATATPQATALALRFVAAQPSTVVLPIARGAEVLTGPRADAGPPADVDAGAPPVDTPSSCACRAHSSRASSLSAWAAMSALLVLARRRRLF